MISFLLFIFQVRLPPTCLPPSLAHRMGRENCWVQFHLDETHRICLTRLAWIDWLKEATPLPVCLPEPAQWRVFSPLQNSPHAPPLKKAYFTLTLQTLENREVTVRPGLSLLLKGCQFIERIREKGSRVVGPHDRLGILRSLLFDEKSSQTPLSLLRKLGFVHLVSATGIHLYALGAWWNWIIRELTRELYIPIRIGLQIARVGSFSICGAVWLLSGARLGMLRPALVILLRRLGQELGFRWRRASPLLLALVLEWSVVVFSSPSSRSIPSFFNLGRTVYALAVGGGLLWQSCFKFTHWGLAVGSWVLVAAVEAWETGLISLATPFLSLVTLPILCTVTYPFLLFGLVLHFSSLTFLSETLLSGIGWGVHTLIVPLTSAALFPGNLWMITRRGLILGAGVGSLVTAVGIALRYGAQRTLKNYPFIQPLLVLSGIALLCLKAGRLCNPPARLPIAYPTPPLVRGTNFIETEGVHLLDVGQGEAALVIGEFPGLIDVGSQKALTDSAWLELFAQRNIDRLSWIAITHLDEDHVGGALRISKLLPIRCIATSAAQLRTPRGEKFRKLLETFGLKLEPWESGCVPFPVLNPPQHEKLSRRSGPNAGMSALWIPLGSQGFFLSAGDATSTDELRIAPWAESLSKGRTGPRILKISHHGSLTSTHPSWLHQLQPTEAWISTGKGNRYGHPAYGVLERLNQFHIPVRRTDLEGFLRSGEMREGATEAAFPHRSQKYLQSPKMPLRSENSESRPPHR